MDISLEVYNSQVRSKIQYIDMPHVHTKVYKVSLKQTLILSFNIDMQVSMYVYV